MCFPCIDRALVEIECSTECGEQHEADNELVEERHRQTAQLGDGDLGQQKKSGGYGPFPRFVLYLLIYLYPGLELET